MQNEVLAARYNRLLQKLLTMKGPVPSPQLSGDIMASIILENDRVEFGFLSGEAHFLGFVNAAAVAGQLSIAGIFNGQQTGALVIVDAIYLTNNAGAPALYNITMGNSGTGLSGTSHPQSTDMRWLGKKSTAAIGSASEVAVGGQNLLNVQVPATQTLILPVRMILPPNVTPTPVNGAPNIYVEGNVANTAVEAGFLWRERALEPSEGPVPGA